MSIPDAPPVKRKIRVWRPPAPDPLAVALGRLEPHERLTYVAVAREVAGGNAVSGDLVDALLTVIRRLAMETGDKA